MRFFSRAPPAPARAGAAAVPSPEVLRAVRKLEFRTRGFVESLFGGEYLSVFMGRGMEFSHARVYQVGDDVRTIDWKVTARKGEPFVRQYVEERDLLAVLVVDVSGSERFGPGERGPGEIAAEICAALAFTAERNNDRVALVLATDRVEHFVPPGSGRKHVIGLLTDLLSTRPEGVATDLVPALEHVARRIHMRATVFLVSDFLQDPREEAFRAAFRAAGRAHDLVAIRLGSAATHELPNVGWVEVADPESGRRVMLDCGSRRARRAFAGRGDRMRADLAALLVEAAADLVDVETDADPLAPIAAFFQRRRRVRR
jgi:uncharacterized protein (DUF58 family)